MNREETRKAAEVMMHFANGGEIECRTKSGGSNKWIRPTAYSWDWADVEYRIKRDPVEIVVYALIELETGRICSYHVTEAMANACLVELQRVGSKGLVIQCKGTYTCDT